MGIRRDVLWLGRTGTDKFQADCRSRGNRELHTVNLETWRECSSTACALALEVPFDDEPFEWAPDFAEEVLVHGLLLALVQPFEPVDISIEQFGNFYHKAKQLYDIDPSRVKLFYRGRDEVLDWLDMAPSTPGPNLGLRLSGPAAVEGADWTLFQRAFCDAEEIFVEELPGGMSGARVYKVQPFDGSRRPRRPLIAKRHSLEKKRNESSNYQSVRDSIPLQLHAPLLQGKCVEGTHSALSVYEFVGDAIPLTTALQAGNPGRILPQLFRGAFLQSIRNAQPSLEEVGVLLDDGGVAGVVKWTDELERSAQRARGTWPEIPAPQELREVLRSLGPMTCRIGMVHGDLHSGNVLYSRGIEAAVPIDYGRVMASAPIAMDPATLEVSLVFPQLGADSLLEQIGSEEAFEAWLHEKYAPPLTIHGHVEQTGGLSWLSEAIAAIRIEALSMEPNPRIYTLAIASALLRTASYPDHGRAQARAIAYGRAAILLTTLAAEESEA